MKIAITGATGDIGGSFIAHTAAESINVLARAGARLRSMPTLTTVERFDFQDGHTYSADFIGRFTDADAVVHCAEILNANNISIADYIATNVMLTALIARSCAQQDSPPKLVYISSEMIYTLSDEETISKLADRLEAFCAKRFKPSSKLYDLRVLADQFIAENDDFPFSKFNNYALTKFLGEVMAQRIANATILRVTNSYGPDYENPRLIPKLIVGRLTGHGATYTREKRDFVYSTDINTLINSVISKNISGIIDCKSGTLTDTEDLSNTIVSLTPTAYGALESAAPVSSVTSIVMPPADIELRTIIGQPMPFAAGLITTLRHHKQQCYHEMINTRSINDFLLPDEHVVKLLKGSSAAYLCIVEGSDHTPKVRKVAFRDGVEGNGIAKVAKEIEYYKHIAQYKPKLASLYPKLIDSEITPTFSSETIEYLDGPNFYESIRSNARTFSQYQHSLQEFINTICVNALDHCVPVKDADRALDAYYIERSLARLQPIKDIVQANDTIHINGKDYLAPHVMLADLLTNTQLRRYLLPSLECFCFHGDMTLLNTIYMAQTSTTKLIDPRGHIGLWDPLYDFAKLTFTLSGFGEFILGDQTMVSKVDDGYTIDFEKIPPVSRKLHAGLFGMLEANALFKNKIISHEPHWRQRIAFAEATHYLADIPFRLFTDGTTWSAMASYILGTYYLNQAYEELQNEHTI